MIENLDTERFADSEEPGREGQVLRRWRRIARRVVVEEDDGGRVIAQRSLLPLLHRLQERIAKHAKAVRAIPCHVQPRSEQTCNFHLGQSRLEIPSLL